MNTKIVLAIYELAMLTIIFGWSYGHYVRRCMIRHIDPLNFLEWLVWGDDKL